MKHLITFVCAAVLTLCCIAEESKPCCSTAAKNAVVATVKLYIAAGEKGDSKIAKLAFAPGATMSWSENALSRPFRSRPSTTTSISQVLRP